MLAILSIALGLFGTISLIAYLLNWWLYSSRVFVKVGGEQLGEPIPVAKQGRVYFVTGTRSKKKSAISEIQVSFSAEDVDLFKTKGITKEITVDNRFPMAIVFNDKKDVIKKVIQGNFFDYQTLANSFSVKFTTVSTIDHTEIPFLLSMFPPRKMRSERTVRFLVKENTPMDLKIYGIVLDVRETMQMVGIQSQEAVWAATSKGEATVKIMEVLDE